MKASMAKPYLFETFVQESYFRFGEFGRSNDFFETFRYFASGRGDDRGQAIVF